MKKTYEQWREEVLRDMSTHFDAFDTVWLGSWYNPFEPGELDLD